MIRLGDHTLGLAVKGCLGVEDRVGKGLLQPNVGGLTDG